MQIFHDTFELKGKHATIMRDGVYLYMPEEIGIVDGRNPNIPVQVYRPAIEVEKAYKRFLELQRLPITIRHPNTFLDHNISDTWKNGEGKNPILKKEILNTVIDCEIDIKNEGIKDYEAGTRELSCGWSGEFQKATTGTYEFIQIFNDINHIAIVPSGRCGTKCKINDGGIPMTKLERILSFLKLKKVEISDDDKEVLKALALDEEPAKKDPEEDPDKMKDKKKKKSKDQDPDEDCNDEEEEEKKTEDKKKKNKDAAVLDAAIADAFAKGQKDIRDKFVSSFNDVMPILHEFKAEELKDKTPCEMKAMFVKKMTDEDIKDSDPALNAIFKMALKHYEHPAYKKITNTEETEKKVSDAINDINFSENKKTEVK